MSGRKTVVVADDHPLLLRGIEDMLISTTKYEIVAACTDGQSALDVLRQLQPDLAVLDVDMPLQSGVDIARTVNRSRMKTRIVLLTASITDAQILSAVELGVHGLLLKDSAPSSLLDCLGIVAAGGRWLPREIIGPAIARENERRSGGRRLLKELSPRELEILQIVAEGHSNKTVALRLDLTEGTIKVHLHNIYQKLGVPNRTSLTRLVVESTDLQANRQSALH